MELKTKKLYIDFGLMTLIPAVDDFIVSIGKKGVGSVYHVASVRGSKSVRGRFHFEVYKADDMKSKVHHNPNSGKVWVDNRPAFTVYWYPRTKKK